MSNLPVAKYVEAKEVRVATKVEFDITQNLTNKLDLPPPPKLKDALRFEIIEQSRMDDIYTSKISDIIDGLNHMLLEHISYKTGIYELNSIKWCDFWVIEKNDLVENAESFETIKAFESLKSYTITNFLINIWTRKPFARVGCFIELDKDNSAYIFEYKSLKKL